MNKNAHIDAHKHSSLHRSEILESENCGCFCWLVIFSPLEIVEWVDSECTAICPVCSIDSVIDTASGYPITKDFLAKMERHWFEMRNYDN